jgi:signal transduction histidine kinase
VGGALLSTALLALAAFSGDQFVHRPQAAARRTLAATAVALAAIAAVVLAAGDALPAAVPPSLSPADITTPQIVGDPIVLGTQVLSMLLFAAAAAGFAGFAERTGDALARWLAVGATLGAFARLNYFLFPSLYTEWFYAGDVLRLGCFLAIFLGALHETRRLQEAVAASAVLSERQRVARDLHDGVAQDLAFVVQQLRRADGSDAWPPGIQRVVMAAERALDESRHAIASLARSPDRPLAEVLSATAREAGEREGCVVETHVPEDLALPPHTQEELLRVVREAVLNAARHGEAHRIRLEVTGGAQVHVLITDDGRGFDPVAARAAPGRMGLATMQHRVDAIGGDLAISSEPGRGTQVRVTLR